MYQNDDKSSYEYHYSYRSDSEGFRPDQTPAPMELQKPKRGRAKRVAAGILCGVLLVGGSVGEPDDAQRPPPHRGGDRQRHRQ